MIKGRANMKLKGKLAALEKIHDIYDEFTASLELACKKSCAYCCTTSVTLTTLEGYKIIKQLKSEKNTDWIDKIQRASEKVHFQPKMTTNQFAQMCAAGIDPPEEEQPASNTCPFLSTDLCPLYTVRPFGCRCLISRHDCGQHGYADIDDFALSVNTVMLQTIEHLDAGGCSGNMLDVLKIMSEEKNRQAYKEGKLKCASKGLLANQPLKVLMIPPQHRHRMQPILQSLRNIRI
jgi:Fe-S-cluster containining protein